MKKLIMSIVAISLALTSCVSAPGLKDLSLVDPIGVVSVTSNGDIGWYGEEKEAPGLFNNVIGKKLNAKKDDKTSAVLSRADNLVELLDQKLTTKLSEQTAVAYVEKDVVVNSNAYLAISEDKQMSVSLIKAANYKFLNAHDSTFASNLNADTGIKGQVHINVDFTKKMMSGLGKTGKLGVSLVMNVQIIDTEGKNIFTKSYFSMSKGTTKIVAGVYDPTKLTILYEEVIEEATINFVNSFIQ